MRWARGERAGASEADEARIDALASSSVFAGCDRAALRRIASLGTELRRGPDAVLQRPGALLRQVLVVLEGVVAERPAHGRERAVSAGHVLGEEALTRRHARARAGAVALTDVRVLVLGPAELADVALVLADRAPVAVPRRAPRPVLEPAWGSARPALA